MTSNEVTLVKKVNVPENLKGLVIGKQKSGLLNIARTTGTRVFLDESNEICVKGNSEQVKLVEKMIKRKLKGGFKKEFKLCKALMIGINGETLRRLETKSGAKINLRPIDDKFVRVTIKGSSTNCDRAYGLIQETILSCSDYLSLKQFGGGEHFVSFNEEYIDAEFFLKEHEDTPKLNCYISGTLYRIEITNKDDYEIHVSDTALGTIRSVFLPILTKLHQQKDEKKLMVDLWCNFGKVFVHNVMEGEVPEDKRLTVGYINERFGKSTRRTKANISNDKKSNLKIKDHWKTTFQEGVCGDKVSGYDAFLQHQYTQWRYDYAFATPSGKGIRFKAWENLRSNEPPPEVKNLLNEVKVQDQESNLVSWLCYPSYTLVKCDLLVPNSEYDCRVKLRTGSRFVTRKSIEVEEEGKILSDYLSHCTLDNHHLNLPSDDIPLPDGFQCLFYRAAQEDSYSYEEDEDKEEVEVDEGFTIIFLDENGWDSDTSEKRSQKQLGIRVVMNSWADALLYGTWEPHEVLSMLPRFMEFVGGLQKLLFE